MNDYSIIGIIAAALTTLAFVPQAIKVIKSKQTKAISLSSYVCLVTGVAMWLIYGIVINDFPIILANSITIVFAVTILAYKVKYK